MTKYQPTIGLEIHAELNTETKMFCSCHNDLDESHPNIHVCPICLGHPGTLPTANKEAIKKVILLGLALEGEIADEAHFDRKSYFYPDLPKGYQISQYDDPLVENAELFGVEIRRIHLEEDTGRLLHSSDGKSSLVDFNRAGVPLMELVTEPNIKDAKQAVEFAKELQLILKYLGISQANMERGEMRVEANVSISKDEELGTKVELKNLNSFKAVEQAIAYELERQEKILEEGGELEQETRGWSDDKKQTVSQRTKEFAHDYRYFPEPDIPPFELSTFNVEGLRDELVELPDDKRKRFKKEFNLNKEKINQLVEDKVLADYFEGAASELATLMDKPDYELLCNYLTSDLKGLMSDRGVVISDVKILPEHLAHLITFIKSGKLSSRMAKDVMLQMFESGLDPESIIKEGSLEVVGGEKELEHLAGELIKENEKAVKDFRAGKEEALKYLVGQMMAKTKGQADPRKSEEVLKNILKE